jgi:hypothetical protein
MKKSWIFMLTFVPWLLNAQIFADGKNLNEMPDLEYIYVDFICSGRVGVFYSNTQELFSVRAKNQEGKKLTFSNVTVFLNYFYKNGWELQGTQEDGGYIFKKRKL